MMLSSDSAMDETQVPRHDFRARALALFLPGLVISAGYGLVYGYLHMVERADGHLARLVFAVLMIACPLILTWAGLRLATIRLQLGTNGLEAHPGFPARDPIALAYRDLDGVSIRRDMSSRLTGTGTLVLQPSSGKAIIIEALGDAEGAEKALVAHLARFRHQ